MNRGTVMSLERGSAIVLTPDGRFVRVKNRGGFQVGEEIAGDAFARAIPRSRKRVLQGGASVAALLLVFAAFLLTRTPPVVAYVSMDVNPSIEFGLDKNERVRELLAENEDARQLIDGVKYKGETIERVMDEVARKLVEDRVLTPEDGDIVIASVPVKSVDPGWEQQVTRKMIASLNEASEHKPDAGVSLEITAISVPKEVRDEAKANGISSGKMAFWLVSESQGHEVELETLKKQSMKEIASSWGGVKKVLGDYERKPKAKDDGIKAVPSGSPAPGKPASGGGKGDGTPAAGKGGGGNAGGKPASGQPGKSGDGEGKPPASGGKNTTPGKPGKPEENGKPGSRGWNNGKGNGDGNERGNGWKNGQKDNEGGGRAPGSGWGNRGNGDRQAPGDVDDEDDRSERGGRVPDDRGSDRVFDNPKEIGGSSGRNDGGRKNESETSGGHRKDYREGRENEKGGREGTRSDRLKAEREDAWKKMLDDRKKRNEDDSKGGRDRPGR